MELERINMRDESYQASVQEIHRCGKLCFQINRTEPHSEEGRRLTDELFESPLPEGSVIFPPMQIDLGKRIKIGKNVIINHNLTCMSRGSIEIEDDVMIGPEVALLTAIFFGNEGNSSQGGLIRMGKITSDLSVFETMEDNVAVTVEIADRQEGEVMQEYDFSVFENVELIGVDLSAMSGEQIEVLYQQARYCQAMTDADIVTMRELVPEDMTFTHMSGRQQTREEYFADVENGSLRYFTIGIDSPVVEVDGYTASVTYTSVLNANAYGARGTYRMTGTHWFEKWQDKWFLSNAPDE